MCSTVEDTCSHIIVPPHVAELVLTLGAIAHISCSEHAGVILKAACLLRHAFAEPVHSVIQVPDMKRLEYAGVSQFGA
jgi:hypothetical protein